MNIDLVKKKATQALKGTADFIKNRFEGKIFEERLKGFSDYQTNVDIEVEKQIHRDLSATFPDWGFLGEEDIYENTKSQYVWILDPICSTNNFVFGLPLFGTALGLMKENDIILSFIYLPLFDNLLWAMKGSGAFLNDKPICVSKRNNLKDALVLYDNQFYKSDKMITNLIKLSDKCFTMRITGSAAYDMFSVAIGVAEARIFHKTKYYDFFQASLLIEESGGCITNFKGEKVTISDTEVLASNGYVHNDILKIINSH